MSFAVVLGVLGAVIGLFSLKLVDLGGRWGADFGRGWFGGHWWWVAVTSASGLLIGLLRRLTRLPDQVPGLFDDLRTSTIDTKLVPGTVAVSALSLAAGASVGPEKVLATIGAGAGSWMGRRRGMDDGDTEVNTFAGIAGIFGGLFSSPVIVVLMILEIARPGGGRFSKVLVTGIVAGSVSFGIYFALAGAVFLGAYEVPSYPFRDWQLLAAPVLGLFGAVVTVIVVLLNTLASWLFSRVAIPSVAKAMVGGMIFGVVGVMLPLTMFSGGDQLAVVLDDSKALGLGLCVASLIAKMLTCAVSQASGFVGGPIFPALFLGGTGGVVVHQVFPGVPLGLAFSCLLPAVLGSLAAAPMSMVLLAAFLTRVGPLETSSVLISVVTTYLGVEALRHVAGRKRAAGGPGAHVATAAH